MGTQESDGDLTWPIFRCGPSCYYSDHPCLGLGLGLGLGHGLGFDLGLGLGLG